jgi:hypothetical protein
MFILPTKYIGIISAINFAYFSRYTLQEVLVLPLLILYQASNALITDGHVYHECSVNIREYQYVAYLPLSAYANNNNSKYINNNK